MVRNLRICAVGLFWATLGVSVAWSQPGGQVGPPDPPVVNYCKSLSYSELYAYVRKLGARKDFASLELIYKAKFSGSSYALTVIACEMDSSKVVPFCRSFPVGSAEWERVFYVLDNHPKRHVIRYIKQVARSPDPSLRALCYDVCRKGGWDDLLANARKDANLNSPKVSLFVPGSPFDETLQSTAASYIRSIDQKKKRQPRGGR